MDIGYFLALARAVPSPGDRSHVNVIGAGTPETHLKDS